MSEIASAEHNLNELYHLFEFKILETLEYKQLNVC